MPLSAGFLKHRITLQQKTITKAETIASGASRTLQSGRIAKKPSTHIPITETNTVAKTA